MGHKIQAQTGITLPELYDVVGTQAPIEVLNTEDGVSFVHEMGGVIQSERFSTTIRRFTNTVSASGVFDANISDLPGGVSRLLGILVFSDNVSRVASANVAQQDDAAARSFPIWVWDGTNSIDTTFFDATVAARSVLVPSPSLLVRPSLIIGTDQPQSVERLQLRGTATAFGAGDVTLTVLAYIAFSAIGGISSRGLPVPSW